MTAQGSKLNKTTTTFMGKVCKISVIPKDFPPDALPTMEKSLRESGRSRVPGTVCMKYPFKEYNGKYRTGLDEFSKDLLKIEDSKDRQAAQERIKKIREKLEAALRIDLSTSSPYYNHTSRTSPKVEPVRLMDGDNVFNMEDPLQAVTFYWLSVHPTIASSLTSYLKGLFPPDTQFYVNNEDVESEIEYKKKKTANDAIIAFDNWSIEKRRKVARLLDLPIDDDTREEVVYNIVDNFLKSPQVINGVHKGRDPISVFTSYANLNDNDLYVKDVVEKAMREQIYRMKTGGRIFEGELEVFRDKEELISFLMEPENQGNLLELEKKIKAKRLARV